MNKKIYKGNELIAKWLGWKTIGIIDTGYGKPKDMSDVYVTNLGEKGTTTITVDEMKFHIDSNWQWLCLEKISKEENVSIGYVLLHIICIDSSLENKKDLFEEIINCIKPN